MMSVDDIKQTELSVDDRRKPIGRPFTDQEARHVQWLLKGQNAKNIKLVWAMQPGSDGEEFQMIGIRRRDGSMPRRRAVRYVYQVYIDYGWLHEPHRSRRLVEALKKSGADEIRRA